MKRALLIGFLTIQCINLSIGQISSPLGELLYSDTLEKRPLSEWVKIESPESNIWVVGHPNKINFNAAHSGDLAIITDSANAYSNSRNCWFTITVPISEYQCGEGIISFFHKFETDTLTDGGIIEVSYNDGVDWKNIKDDTDHAINNFIGLYQDTLKGGTYGFSGNSNGWQYVELHWVWLMRTKSTSPTWFDNVIVRFRFISDDINTNKDGWMIDDIIVRGYSVIGSVNKLGYEHISAFPNPTNGIVEFIIPSKYESDIWVELCRLDGRTISTKYLTSRKIDLSGYSPGMYIYKVYHKNILLTHGKLIKN